MNWTDDQQSIIRIGRRNLLVAAAAGSGKTAVLVQRILHRLLDTKQPVDIDRFLLMTFTKAAAAQMKERIGRRLEIELESLQDSLGTITDPNRKKAVKQQTEHLQRQLRLLPMAHISTIHSFCTFVIRENYQKLDIDPGFRAGEEGELTLLKKRAMEDTLEEFYQQCMDEPQSEQAIAMKRLVDHYSPGKQDRKIEGLIEKLVAIALQNASPQYYLTNLAADYAGEKRAAEIANGLFQDARKKLEGMADKLRTRAAEWQAQCNDQVDPRIDQWIKMLEADADLFEALEQQTEANGWSRQLSRSSFSRRPAVKLAEDASSPQLQTMASYDIKHRDEYKKQVASLAKRPLQSSETILQELCEIAPHIGMLSKLALRYMELYTENKAKKGIIDFDDMEHLALAVLVSVDENGQVHPTDVASNYADYFEEIMVDEYQDSNWIQETILESITSSRKNRLMVGDVKQSIYRFRQARPDIFNDKYNVYKTVNGTEPTAEQREVKLLLDKNFRSRCEVLDSTNAVFKRLMRADVGHIDYDDSQSLKTGAAFPRLSEGQPDHRTEVLLIDYSREPNYDTALYNKDEAQAVWIACEIKRLQRDGWVYDDSLQTYRRPENRDFAILMRSLSSSIDTYVQIFSTMDLYVRAEKNTGYFSAMEIRTVLAMLSILHNEQRDLDFVTVLTSPMAAVSENELAQIKVTATEKLSSEEKETMGDSFAALSRWYAGAHDDELSHKLQLFFEILDSLKALVRHLSVAELLGEVLDKTGYRKWLWSDKQAERKLGNIRILLEKAREFDSSRETGLFSFLHHIRQLKKFDEDFAEASEAGEGRAISLMTIHKSKGLEFPFVFVAGLSKGFNKTDSHEALVSHHSLGIGLDIIDRERRTRRPSALKRLINLQNELDDMGEEQRILYVAMTRAKEKLYLVGVADKLLDQDEKWQSIGSTLMREQAMEKDGTKRALPYILRSSASNMLDWLMPVIRSDAGRPFFRVTIKPVNALASMMQEEQSTEPLEPRSETDVKTDSSTTESVQPAFRYRFAADTEIPAKVSVSFLKQLTIEQQESVEADEQLPTPAFPYQKYWENETAAAKQHKKLRSGPVFGTAFHKIMEELDYRNLPRTDRSGCLTAMIETLAVKEDWDRNLDLTELGRQTEKFLMSELGQVMQAAALKGNLYREYDFMIGVAARQLSPEWQSDEPVLVQGVIDACYRDAAGCHIVDYKTDHVRQPQELTEIYGRQLELYALAWEQLTGEKVKDCRIYSTVWDTEIILNTAK